MISNNLLTPNSACFGLPSYQESFAVDPNEVLSKDCNSSASTSSSLLSVALLGLPSSTNLSFHNYQQKPQKAEHNKAEGKTEYEFETLEHQSVASSTSNNNNNMGTFNSIKEEEEEKDSLTLMIANEEVNSFAKIGYASNGMLMGYVCFLNKSSKYKS